MIRDIGAILMRNWRYFVLSVLFIIAALIFIKPDFSDFGGDSAQYIIVAEAAAKGLGFKMINCPGSPVSFLYPPVFPALLAAVELLFGRNFYAMYWLIAFLGWLALIFFYRVFKKYSDKDTAFYSVLFLACSGFYLAYSFKYIRSEIPYLFFSALSFWAMRLYCKRPGYFNLYGLLLAAGLLLGYFTRYIGIALFVGVVAFLWFIKKDRKKALFIAASFLFFFGVWNIFKFFYKDHVISQTGLIFMADIYNPQKGTVLTHPGVLVWRSIDGIAYYASFLARTFTNFLPDRWRVGAWPDFITAALLLFGIWVKARDKKEQPFIFYMVTYSIVILLWPAREHGRFFLPLLPFCVFYIFSALTFIMRRCCPKRPKLWCAVAALMLIAGNAASIKHLYAQEHRRVAPNLEDLKAGYRWLKENSAPDDIVVSRKPVLVYFYCGRRSIIYPFTEDKEKIWSAIRDNDVKYILVDIYSREDVHYIIPMLNEHRKDLRLVYRRGFVSIEKVLDGEGK